jgi:hypothetical protein
MCAAFAPHATYAYQPELHVSSLSRVHALTSRLEHPHRLIVCVQVASSSPYPSRRRALSPFALSPPSHLPMDVYPPSTPKCSPHCLAFESASCAVPRTPAVHARALLCPHHCPTPCPCAPRFACAGHACHACCSCMSLFACVAICTRY